MPSLPLPALISNVQDAIVLLDASGKVVFESPSAAAILGIPPGRVLTAFGLDRIHPDDRESAIRSFERTIAVPGSVARATYRFCRQDGEWHHLEALAKNLAEDPDLQGVLITFRDVTERIEALEAARRAGEARDEFLARMSHELRTPLHAVLGWAQLLTASEDRTTAEAAEQIADAGRFLLRLVNDSLDLAAVQEGRIGLDLRAVDVRDAVDEVIELVRPLAAEKDITVRAHVPPGLTVRADADRLRQILLNLLGNAVKFSRYAGEVVVTAAAGAAAARISVEDSGAGIKPENLGLLFERYRRFETLNAATPGTGLGLAIARKLTELMEGTIGVDSSVGEGATFWIELPVATDERSLRETGRRSVVVGTTRGA